jgi:hypothetical protein
MKEPVSMFDWGLFHLERHVSEHLNGIPSTSALGVMIEEYGLEPILNIVYRWEKNRIDIITGLGSPIRVERKLSELQARVLCRLVIIRVRDSQAVDESGSPKYGWEEGERATSSMNLHFIHSDFRNTERPGNLAVELDNMTDISAIMPYGPNEEGGFVECGAPLVDGPIHFVEE